MSTTNYIWDPETDSYLLETDGSNITQATYTNEPVHFGNLVSQRRGSTTNYFHFDALGSTHQLTDATQTVTDTFTYDAWGKVRTQSGASIVPNGWVGSPGYRTDDDLQAIYVRNRWYQSSIGRWNSIDPLYHVNPVDPYRYVKGNPVLLTDPDGLGLTFPPNWQSGHFSIRKQRCSPGAPGCEPCGCCSWDLKVTYYPTESEFEKWKYICLSVAVDQYVEASCQRDHHSGWHYDEHHDMSCARLIAGSPKEAVWVDCPGGGPSEGFTKSCCPICFRVDRIKMYFEVCAIGSNADNTTSRRKGHVLGCVSYSCTF